MSQFVYENVEITEKWKISGVSPHIRVVVCEILKCSLFRR
jgi:hypothetical protein